MPDLTQEPIAMMASLLSQILDQIKGTRPTKTDGSPLSRGYVFSQLPMGQAKSPRDYVGPWSPMGGTPPNLNGPAANPTTTPDPAAAAAAATAASRHAMEVAFNTSQLADTMLQVTTDGSYLEYPTGRHLSFAYSSILQAMEAPAAPPRSASEQAAIETASKVLYLIDADGLPVDSPKYRHYKKNAAAYAAAKAAFAKGQRLALSDPETADSWPLESGPLQAAVDEAWNDWKTQGADEVEAALATVESLGIPLEQGAIARARKLLDVWSLPTSGVATNTPYCAVDPTEWADYKVDDIGWTELTVTSQAYRSHWEQHGGVVTTGDWSANSSSSSGSAGISVFGFGFGGSRSSSSWDTRSHTRSDSWNGMSFHNDAKNLTIDLEYALCEVRRPWLMTDLFYMTNYWVKGHKKGEISDGSIDPDKQNQHLLPMLPTHMLVVRNVSITAEDWGNDGATFDRYFNQSDSHGHGESSGGSVGGFACCGVINFAGGGSRGSSESGGDSSNEGGQDHWSDSSGSYHQGTLKIRGAQIVSWLCEILPISPPLDDPDLANPPAAGTATPDADTATPATPDAGTAIPATSDAATPTPTPVPAGTGGPA
jgi:hypothetical protein